MKSKAGPLKDCQAIVTGAHGFIGKKLTQHLIQNGAFVVGIDIAPLGESPDPVSQFHFVKADLLTEQQTLKLPETAHRKSFFFHLAGMANARECETNKDLAFRLNVGLTLSALKFSLNNKVDHFVFPSTGLVYGDQHQTPVTEDTALSPLNYYAETKMEAEEVIKKFAQNSSMGRTVLRLSNVYGSGMSRQSVIGELIDQVIKGKQISLKDYTPVRDFIFIDDVVDGMLTAASVENTGSRCFNLSTGIGTSIGELVLMASRLSSVPCNQPSSKRKSSAHESYLVLDHRLFEKTTGWKPKYALRDGLKKILH